MSLRQHSAICSTHIIAQVGGHDVLAYDAPKLPKSEGPSRGTSGDRIRLSRINHHQNWQDDLRGVDAAHAVLRQDAPRLSSSRQGIDLTVDREAEALTATWHLRRARKCLEGG